MRIRDVMTKDVEWAAPSMDLRKAAELMRDNDLGALPIGENDRLIGMVTDRDIVIRALPNGRDLDSMTVRDVMTDKVLYCYEDQDAEDVADNMGDNRVRRLPVLNRDKRLVGMVSLGDIARKGAKKDAGEALSEICAHQAA